MDNSISLVVLETNISNTVSAAYLIYSPFKSANAVVGSWRLMASRMQKIYRKGLEFLASVNCRNSRQYIWTMLLQFSWICDNLLITDDHNHLIVTIQSASNLTSSHLVMGLQYFSLQLVNWLWFDALYNDWVGSGLTLKHYSSHQWTILSDLTIDLKVGIVKTDVGYVLTVVSKSGAELFGSTSVLELHLC